MKLVVRMLFVLAIAAAALQAAPPSDKIVELRCSHGWRGSAQGTYGGVGFGVSCNNGRGQVHLGGTSGTAYSIRVGAESDTIAVDCFFPGDSPTVNESCAGVRLSIR
ncbi:MAG TPA: hypothetical protein VJS92_12490 [Candidatus Polarisedimenticolaceae bacterium]|nr:hypothetical protein [Candidatus Polarisedimenticolaceae bacterium]